MKDIIQANCHHSFPISFGSILCTPVEPWSHYILYLTSHSIWIDTKRDSTLWPLSLSLLHLLVPVTYCEPWMLIRSWSSRLPTLGVLCRWTKELWLKQRDFYFSFQWQYCEHYLFEHWFNLQCLTWLVSCSGALCQIWCRLHERGERVLLNPTMKRFCFFRNSEFCSLFLTTTLKGYCL